MTNIDNYVNRLRDDFYSVFVLNSLPSIGNTNDDQELMKTSNVNAVSDKLIFDYESDVEETEDNLLTPWV